MNRILKWGLAAPAVVFLLSGCMSSESAGPTPAPELVVEGEEAATDAVDTATNETAMRAMTGDELLATHTGVCTSYSGPSAGSECFNADGTASFDDATYGQGTGSWRLEANQLCTNYGEGDSCATVQTDGSGRYFSDSGYNWTIKG
ncbi:MAG: hypothetical protein AAF922_16415 [Pseudomonadota bacterium]